MIDAKLITRQSLPLVSNCYASEKLMTTKETTMTSIMDYNLQYHSLVSWHIHNLDLETLH